MPSRSLRRQVGPVWGRLALRYGADMGASSLTVRRLADELDVDPKAVRAWMRRQSWRYPEDAGTAWVMTDEQAKFVRQHFAHSDVQSPIAIPTVASDELAQITAGQLLRRYGDILAELRHRGLVRSNNAPIGDLAEYCAAIVYDKLLAPQLREVLRPRR